MKKISLLFLATTLSFLSFGQVTESQKLIELARTYKDFMFRNEPNKELLAAAKAEVPPNLKTATDFILQTVISKNDLLTKTYLTRPDDKVLKQVYIIREINLNLREENQKSNDVIIDSLSATDIPRYELVDNYYGMLFTAIGNKNQPFNLSKADFKLNEYNLKDDTEKGIFFLRCIEICGSTIWGYMNIVKPANTSKAYDYIKKFPKFNGQPYYQYTDFYFTDFEMNIIKDKGIQSYKKYYLDKYFEVLIFHLICLNKEGGSDKEKNDLLLGSILKERNLYKYTRYKDTLEQIFKEEKRE